MQIWAESGKSALPICNYSQILYQFLTFTQNLKRSPKKSVKINRSVGNSFSAKSISDYLKSEHHSIDNETLSKNAANALADFCICFVKKCHTLQMDFSYFEYGRKQSFHTFFIANPK